MFSNFKQKILIIYFTDAAVKFQKLPKPPKPIVPVKTSINGVCVQINAFCYLFVQTAFSWLY